MGKGAYNLTLEEKVIDRTQKLVLAKEQAIIKANYDSLTKLPNRVYFQRKLKEGKIPRLADAKL